ncbi:tRNA pseudouridine synthase [Pelomyxa schiedti]|nr:tRNA pseudouridine synthase [Pelomyxa schiedti]
MTTATPSSPATEAATETKTSAAMPTQGCEEKEKEGMTTKKQEAAPAPASASSTQATPTASTQGGGDGCGGKRPGGSSWETSKRGKARATNSKKPRKWQQRQQQQQQRPTSTSTSTNTSSAAVDASGSKGVVGDGGVKGGEGGGAVGVGVGESASSDRAPRQKKEKVALFVGYLGEGYHGLQHLPSGLKTIEDVLEEALHRAGGISDDNAGSFVKVKWSRCARTDKGVSAACNVVGLNLILGPDVVEKTNLLLRDSNIRVHGFLKTTNGFCAKKFAEHRTYTYLAPAFSFQDDPIPACPLQGTVINNEEDDDILPAILDSSIQDYPEWSHLAPDSTVLDYVRSIVTLFEGTHNFHNFTVKKAPNDQSARRNILSFTCENPLVVDGMQLVPFRVVGQSFMLHQIRKMIGFILTLVRQRPMPPLSTAKDMLARLMSQEQLGVPTAPAHGLFLEECSYSHYNNLWGSSREMLLSSRFAEQITHIKAELIVPSVVRRERAQRMMQYWLYQTEQHNLGPILPLTILPKKIPPPSPSKPIPTPKPTPTASDQIQTETAIPATEQTSCPITTTTTTSCASPNDPAALRF